MDILQLMKENHDILRRELASAESFLSLGQSSSAKFLVAAQAALEPLAKRVFLSLGIESEFLCPELEDRFPGSLVILDIIEANQRVTKRLAADIWPSADALGGDAPALVLKLGVISQHLIKHLDAIEQLLMPKIRMHIATQEREDLGQIFSDVMGEQAQEEVSFARAKVSKAKAHSSAKVMPLQKKRRA